MARSDMKRLIGVANKATEWALAQEGGFVFIQLREFLAQHITVTGNRMFALPTPFGCELYAGVSDDLAQVVALMRTRPDYQAEEAEDRAA